MATSVWYKKNQNVQYLLSIVAVLVVAAIGYAITGWVGYRVVALMLLVTVSLLAIFFDIAPVMVAAFLSALTWDFFFIPPRFTLSIGNTEDALMLLMYFLIASINAVLTFRIRKIQKEIVQKEEKEKIIKLYSTLLNSLSHELKTPISAIIGSTDNLLMNDGLLTEANKKELINEISTASLRLNQQVGNLLDMSRLESGVIQLKKDWCDVNELIYSAVRRLDEQAKGHAFKISIADNLPLFKVDFGLLEQALYNILLNAVQYTPEGSSILIDAHSSDYLTTDEAGIEMTSSKLMIIIADNGKGFPEGEIDKVFDKFYRVQNSKAGGTGLGLSIAKGFIEAHNGTISAGNWPGGGAEFKIEIPAEASYINALKNE